MTDPKGGPLTIEQKLDIMVVGWRALGELREHARQRPPCAACAEFRRRVQRTGQAKANMHLRCLKAREWQQRVSAVEKMLAEYYDDFECDARRANDAPCVGPKDWVFTRRRRQDGRLLSHQIGCETHVRAAEARAVVAGSVDTVAIERLPDVIQEIAQLMRGRE